MRGKNGNNKKWAHPDKNNSMPSEFEKMNKRYEEEKLKDTVTNKCN
jgi:hypothetical protein